MDEKDYIDKLKKEREITISKKPIKDIWSLHWRLRSELLFREKEDRDGGYHKENDTISKLKEEEIGFLMYICENIRLESGNDTLDT